MNNYKKYIPNILSSLRIIAVPILILLGYFELYVPVIIIAICCSLTDFIDGRLARKWQVTSDIGAKLDALADKLLALGLLLVLIFRIPVYLYVLLLEFLISLVNLYNYFKTHKTNVLLIGKLKTWFVFITLILGVFGIIFPGFKGVLEVIVYITIGMQFITLISYLVYWHKSSQKKNKYDDYVEFYELIEPIIKTEEYLKRKEFPHHIDESAYDHMIRVAFDCYKIGKRSKMDYKSLTIAAILHDFYEKPWQYQTEKLPLFKQHGFTHAQNAIDNAKKVYGSEVVTKKVESIMKTHMFPLNIKPPTSREGWLLTFIDKVDSIDFILHPVILFKILRKEEIDQERKLTLRKVKNIIKRMKESS